MPKIKYTYPKDVETFGAIPYEVPDSVAEVLVVQRRRAVYVADEQCGDCPAANCADCPIQ